MPRLQRWWMQFLRCVDAVRYCPPRFLAPIVQRPPSEVRRMTLQMQRRGAARLLPIPESVRSLAYPWLEDADLVDAGRDHHPLDIPHWLWPHTVMVSAWALRTIAHVREGWSFVREPRLRAGERILIPDAQFTLTTAMGQPKLHLLVEADLATESRAVIREKAVRYRQWFTSARAHLAAPPAQIVIITTTAQHLDVWRTVWNTIWPASLASPWWGTIDSVFHRDIPCYWDRDDAIQYL